MLILIRNMQKELEYESNIANNYICEKKKKNIQ